jgi:predicted transcriptional regulator
MATLTIRLDAKLEKALDRVAKSTGRTQSEIAREALRRQVAVQVAATTTFQRPAHRGRGCS